MRFEDYNWMDIEHYLEHDDRVILVTGATEQHAYLSLLTDILIPSRLALAAAEREHVLIAPPLNFGVSEMFVEFPGTISLSQATFDAVLSEIVEGLLHHGFRRFFILNGHGGNRMPPHLDDLQREGAARVVWYDWWREQAVHHFETLYNLQINHANWGENFPFNRVAESPTTDKAPVDMNALQSGHSARDVLGDGNFGGPYQVSDTLMNELFMRVVDEVCALLRAIPPL
ncbi:MAG: creatininase family protein [Chloroflexi bacterium]|nr:creatininase family protein [Chloroflexota bacterium]